MSTLGKAFQVVKGKLENRSEQRAAAIVGAILEGIDESNALSGLSNDVLRGVAENYELVIPEIRISLRKKVL